jgi:opacity protein-like surface antigen
VLEKASTVKPYITAGVGMARYTGVKRSGMNVTFTHQLVPYTVPLDDTSTPYNFGIGCTFGLSDRVAVDLSYKYIDLGGVIS